MFGIFFIELLSNIASFTFRMILLYYTKTPYPMNPLLTNIYFFSSFDRFRE